MKIVEIRSAILAIAVAGLVAVAPPAFAQVVPGSLAYGLSGVVASAGSAARISAVAAVGATSQKAFSRHSSVPLFSESLGIVSSGNLIGSLAVVTSGIATHVSSNGIASTTVQTEADTAIASLSITLSLVPPTDATQPPAAPLLSLTATGITAQVTDTQSLLLTTQQTGTASFGSLTLSGSMVGSQTLTFQGAAPANTVLYDDPNMTVTLNQQDVTGVIECTPTCQFVPQKMTADAILVEMYRKTFVGKKVVTGNVYVAQDEATLQ